MYFKEIQKLCLPLGPVPGVIGYAAPESRRHGGLQETNGHQRFGISRFDRLRLASSPFIGDVFAKRLKIEQRTVLQGILCRRNGNLSKLDLVGRSPGAGEV